MNQQLQSLRALHGLAFVKMNGSGNDFVLVDNRQARLPVSLMPALARGLCARGRSVGADGLIILEPSDTVDSASPRLDFVWHFFNADGSSAEMCGNGGRCAARFALDQGLAGPEMVFGTLAGPIRAWVSGESVKLEMVPPRGAYAGLVLATPLGPVTLHGVNTGVPHAVVPVEDLQAAPVKELGRALRFHQHFAPAGSNINFICPRDGQLWVRTYERGVEDETLACGTGAVASALVAGSLGWLKSPVEVRVRSGETLKVHFTGQGDALGPVLLEGGAAYVYEGVLHREAFQWMAY